MRNSWHVFISELLAFARALVGGSSGYRPLNTYRVSGPVNPFCGQSVPDMAGPLLFLSCCRC